MGKKNAVAKGRRTEKLCADLFIAKGWLTWKTIRHRYLNIDLWGLFDVCVLAPTGDRIILIQCKTGYCDGRTRQRIQLLLVPPGVSKQIWCWRKGRWHIEKYRGGE